MKATSVSASRRSASTLSRRLFTCSLLLAATLPASAFAGFNFFLSEYTASRDELQAQVVKQFPVRQRYAEIFVVTLRDPQLGLDGKSNRAALTALLTITSPLLGRTVDGVVSVSSGLYYDATTRTLRLDQPKAERLELQGVGGRDAERLQQIAAVVAQELLNGQALRTFTAEELTVGRKTYEIGDITVLDNGIKVVLK